MKMKLTIAILCTFLFLMIGCKANDSNSSHTSEYKKINAEEAKKLMDSEEELVILDVRTKEEFDTGHIAGALLLPLDSLKNAAEETLPNKDQLILVYCRSGNRSETATNQLIEMGYTHVIDFGGIIDWPYEIVQ